MKPLSLAIDALERRAQIAFVRDPACRSLLSDRAPLQAFLRY